ncbi:MAG TPA: class I SAM-dependent methyltransferase [Candidatus Paceibacterota bacterium]|nr:class I SAM-dependent methyltransferase [Candidatus Paceibacterota bacterium]
MDRNGQAQEQAWEAEYRSPQMLSRTNRPSADIERFTKWIRRKWRLAGLPNDFDGMTVLDLGTGTGRNAFHFAEWGAKVIGYEVSDTALALARGFAQEAGLPITYEKRDIGAPYPLPDASVDIVLDVTSSNSLSDAARDTYLSEMFRVLKPGGHAFVRALSKEGDDNAKTLIKRAPGPDPDSYVHPDLKIAEKTFTKGTFTERYGRWFRIAELAQSTHYPTVGGRLYKRKYWTAYLEKPTGA